MFFLGTNLNTLYITRRELLNIMQRSKENIFEKQYDFLVKDLQNRTNCQRSSFTDLKKKLQMCFKYQYKYRWTKACRVKEKFFRDNKEWLDKSLSFPRFQKQTEATMKMKRGRPHIPFESCSERSKRLRAKQLRDSSSTSSLVFATCMGLRSEGQIQASKVLKNITTSPNRAIKYQNAYKKSVKPQQQLLSGENALSVLIDAKLSREQYNVIRRSAPEKFPSYKIVQEAKKECYPKNITVTEICASVTLQALLDHTSERLIQVLEPVIESLENEELQQLCLISKWGFDGSSGHSSYKQAFCDSEATDSAVFITSLVPLRIVAKKSIIWENPRPASTRYCRPIKIEFVKESNKLCVAEKNKMDKQIKTIQDSDVEIKSRKVKINHKLIFSMVDGKVCNALTETSSTMKCFICGATSIQFNKIDKMISRDIKTENLEFGLSVLHGWIRIFECLLHMSYKLPVKKWQVREEKEKEIVTQNKMRIQKEFRSRCGLIVDKPKPGFGNSNDGNTARRFFQNPDISAQITGIDVDLIKKLHIILIVISSSYEIHVENYRVFAYDTARYFVSKYPWYNMPPTLHKYLIHGPEIISSALLPIGQMTEEAQEARNKDFKRYREYYSRKCSREKTNRDIFNFLLLSSDPVITSKQIKRKKRLEHLPQEALHLLKTPSLNASSDQDSESDDDSDDNMD